MSENFSFGLRDISKFFTTPQEKLKSVTNDYSSIFGTFDINKELKGISLNHSEENLDTPFTYNNVMGDIFEDKKEEIPIEYDNYDWDGNMPSAVEFEC